MNVLIIKELVQLPTIGRDYFPLQSNIKFLDLSSLYCLLKKVPGQIHFKVIFQILYTH